jgi:hypothetical protein
MLIICQTSLSPFKFQYYLVIKVLINIYILIIYNYLYIMYNINVELANLYPVPQYLVHEAIHELQSLMKTSTHVLCTVP